MSIKLCSAVWESGAYSGTPLNVLLAMADHGKDDGSDIYPSIELVAFKARLTRRGAQLVVRKLEADGVLVCVGSASGGAYRPREYRIALDRLMALGAEWRAQWEAQLAERQQRRRRRKGEPGFAVSRETEAGAAVVAKGEPAFALSPPKGEPGFAVSREAEAGAAVVAKGEPAFALSPPKGEPTFALSTRERANSSAERANASAQKGELVDRL